MTIEIVRAKKSEKSVLRQLMELCNHDFSEHTGDDVDEHGFYGYTYLDHYWTDEARHPFFIMANGRYAGFVLVNNHCKYISGDNIHSVAEFFVLRKYRKKGVGRQAAKMIFDKFDGLWEVKILYTNVPALSFWSKVIDEYSGGRHTFHSMPAAGWDGLGYTFNSNTRVH